MNVKRYQRYARIVHGVANIIALLAAWTALVTFAFIAQIMFPWTHLQNIRDISQDLFSGLGYSQAFGAFCVVSYYSALMALTLYYLVSCFQSELPWSFCRPEWKDCIDDSMFKNVSEDRIATIQSSAELYFRFETETALTRKWHLDANSHL